MAEEVLTVLQGLQPGTGLAPYQHPLGASPCLNTKLASLEHPEGIEMLLSCMKHTAGMKSSI